MSGFLTFPQVLVASSHLIRFITLIDLWYSQKILHEEWLGSKEQYTYAMHCRTDLDLHNLDFISTVSYEFNHLLLLMSFRIADTLHTKKARLRSIQAAWSGYVSSKDCFQLQGTRDILITPLSPIIIDSVKQSTSTYRLCSGTRASFWDTPDHTGSIPAYYCCYQASGNT